MDEPNKPLCNEHFCEGCSDEGICISDITRDVSNAGLYVFHRTSDPTRCYCFTEKELKTISKNILGDCKYNLNSPKKSNNIRHIVNKPDCLLKKMDYIDRAQERLSSNLDMKGTISSAGGRSLLHRMFGLDKATYNYQKVDFGKQLAKSYKDINAAMRADDVAAIKYMIENVDISVNVSKNLFNKLIEKINLPLSFFQTLRQKYPDEYNKLTISDFWYSIPARKNSLEFLIELRTTRDGTPAKQFPNIRLYRFLESELDSSDDENENEKEHYSLFINNIISFKRIDLIEELRTERKDSPALNITYGFILRINDYYYRLDGDVLEKIIDALLKPMPNSQVLISEEQWRNVRNYSIYTVLIRSQYVDLYPIRFQPTSSSSSSSGGSDARRFSGSSRSRRFSSVASSDFSN